MGKNKSEFKDQAEWFDLVDECGSEEAAEKELVRQLRMFADAIEEKGYPKVFGCECKNKSDLRGGLMHILSVTLSYPWGG